MKQKHGHRKTIWKNYKMFLSSALSKSDKHDVIRTHLYVCPTAPQKLTQWGEFSNQGLRR